MRGLAARLGVSKPVITRALDTMGGLKLVARHRDETDRRKTSWWPGPLTGHYSWNGSVTP